MVKKPDVSVVIATKNEASNLPRLLDSILRQTYQDLEIVIVDNFSTDETLKIARQSTPHAFTHGDERSAQRNYGAGQARGRYLLFLDADMELPKSIVNECYQISKKTNCSAVIIPETTPGNNIFARIKRLEKKMYEGESFIEAARFIKRKAYLTVSGYNEKIVAGEDWDLSKRLSEIGVISRISTPLLHYEVSLIRELKHKLYYSRLIKSYATLHPDQFKMQSGYQRLELYWRKRQILFDNPLTGSGLLLIKTIEYLLFQSAKLF